MKRNKEKFVWTPTETESLRKLVRCYYDYQEEELRLRGIMGIKKDDTRKKGARDYDEHLVVAIHERIEEVVSFVGKLEKDAKKVIHEHPMWDCFFKEIKGCGEMMAAVILTEIDIRKADTVSKIWQFAGLNSGMVRGKKWKGSGKNKKLVVTDTMVRGDKRTEGFLRPYNQFLKDKLLGVLGSCFLKAASDYATVYYHNCRHRLESMRWGNDSKNPTNPDNPKAGHQHRAAIRFMMKEFIKDLYQTWRTLEGLPVRPPYAEEYLGRVHHNGRLTGVV